MAEVKADAAENERALTEQTASLTEELLRTEVAHQRLVTQLRSDLQKSSVEVTQVQKKCALLHSTCTCLREEARPCITCDSDDDAAADDDCPAKLAEALRKLRGAEVI